jgi:hypothetical protein
MCPFCDLALVIDNCYLVQDCESKVYNLSLCLQADVTEEYRFCNILRVSN